LLEGIHITLSIADPDIRVPVFLCGEGGPPMLRTLFLGEEEEEQ
jgi:hypothetical protein